MLKPIIGIGACFACPGGGHLYGRRPRTGLLVAAGLVLSLVLLVTGGLTAYLGLGLFVGLVGFDLVGGQRAIAAFNAQQTASLQR